MDQEPIAVQCDAGSEECTTIVDATPERDKIQYMDHAKEQSDERPGEGVVKDNDDGAHCGPTRDRIDTGASVTSLGSLDEWCVMSEASVNREIFEDLQSHNEVRRVCFKKKVFLIVC